MYSARRRWDPTYRRLFADTGLCKNVMLRASARWVEMKGPHHLPLFLSDSVMNVETTHGQCHRGFGGIAPPLHPGWYDDMMLLCGLGYLVVATSWVLGIAHLVVGADIWGWVGNDALFLRSLPGPATILVHDLVLAQL